MKINSIIPYLKIIKINIAIICFLLISDLNGVMESLIGIGQLLSPLILISSIINLILVYVHKKHFLFNKSILIILSFYTFYFFFSGIVRISNYDKLFYGIPFSSLFMGYFTSVIIISAVYFSTLVLIKEGQVNLAFNIIIFALIFSTATVIFTDVSGIGNFTQGKEDLDNTRASGFFANPNEAGLVANFCFVFIIFFFIENIGSKKLLILLMAASVYASFRSFSKTSMVISAILLVYFIYYLYNYYLKNKKVLKVIITTIIVASLALIIFAINNLDELTKDWDSNQRIRIEAFTLLLTQGELETETDTERGDAFKFGINIIKESPFIGKGYGYLQYGIISNNQGVHNTYLMVFGESGIIGFLLFIYIFIQLSGFILFYQEKKSIIFLFTSVIIIILINCMTSHNVLLFRPINVVLAVLAALTGISGKKVNQMAKL